MQQQIRTKLQEDCKAWTAQVRDMIEAELVGENVQEIFCNLKEWYWAASETTTCPCPQTMLSQTSEQIVLYGRRDSPGNPLPININPILVDDVTPTDGEVQVAPGQLTNRRAGGVSGMQAEDKKA